MNLKKRIAEVLARFACRLDPEIKGSSVKDFDHKKLGLTMFVSNDDAKKYCKSQGISLVKADNILIKEAKQRIKRSIFIALETKKMYSFDVRSVKDGFEVCGYIDVYSKKKNDD